MNKASIEIHVNEKEKVMHPEIVVRGTKDKPYYEIKYYDVTDKQWHLGYGSYNLEYVMQWKEECLEVVEGSITNELCEKIKERLRTEKAELTTWAEDMAFELGIDKAIEIVNQVAEEYNQSLANNNQSLTNADKIRNMTDEKLAEFLFEQAHCGYCNIRTKCRQSNADDCKGVFLEWLQSEVEE